MPLSSTCDDAYVNNILIQPIHLSPKPFALRMSMIVECSIRSKAFSKSKEEVVVLKLDFEKRQNGLRVEVGLANKTK